MAEKTTYPYIPEKNWWIIRDQFLKSIPKQVTISYLKSLLNISEGSARNLIGPLRQLGLIDNDDNTTELANRWRNDETYASACQSMIASVYSKELIELYSGTNIDKARVQNWFMYNAGYGDVAARQATSMYVLLNDATIRSSSEFTSKSKSTATPKSKVSLAKSNSKSSKVEVPNLSSQQTSDSEPISLTPVTNTSSNIWSKGISLHIDLQIHISPDATPSQIDQIFASMAKHLPTIAQQANTDD